ncbi:helix-turn-helix domain-containing protein [Streptomyces sp. NPDC048584]|uniref:helix-turn-helix domain-containing protein n=1 Tax=Streptomyces sp. NPDC048584 TaxID=3365573 RepID=UPI0037196793
MTVSAQDDVAEFAALLRKLKERTDRSYGSLARRLGMNTSTLHRYCAGDAVPVDFAPVERFAALCGASRAERLDLHHRWLRAVEARQRPRGVPGSPANPDAAPGEQHPAAREGTGTPAVAGGETPGGPPGSPRTPPTGEPGGRPAGHSAADTTGVPDTTPRAEPTSHAGARLGTAPLSGVPSGRNDEIRPTDGPGTASGADLPHHGRKPGADPETGDAAAPPPDTVTGPGATDGPSGQDKPNPTTPDPGRTSAQRPWYRRRGRVLVAMAAACALLATVGSLSALPDDRRASAEGAKPRDAAPSVSSGSPTTSPSRTPSPSGSPSPATRTHPASSSPTPRHKPAAPGTSEAPAAPPLTWSADSQAWAYGCGHDYVIAKPPDQVPPPPAPQDAGTWAATQAAVHGGETLVELSVQGTSETAVVLTALRVRVAGRSGPVPGNAYAMDQGCGGALTPRYFDVDLDKDRPIARAVAGNDAGTPIPAVRMPYRVSVNDPEVLLVTARAAGCDCRWYLELDWSSRGRTGTVRIDDHGRPFRTSGIEGLPHYEYDTSSRGWQPRAG